MTDILVPDGSLKGIDTGKLKIKVHTAARVDKAFRILFA